MQIEHIEGGALFAKLEDRTVSGLLVPWGEVSRPNSTGQGPVSFERGSIKVPRDISIVSANIEHDRYTPVARASSIEDTDAGLVAAFSIAQTDDGDQFLSDVAEGKFSKLSAEVKGLVVKGSKAVSAVLTGAAFVTEGAFASAALFSIAPATEAESEAEEVTPAEVIDHPDKEITPAQKDEDTVTVATVPNSIPVAQTPEAPARTTLREVTEALAQFSRNGDRTLISALAEKPEPGEHGMFALTDVKLTTTGSVGAAGVLQQPQWLGDIWAGRTYQRKTIPLLTHADLTSFKVTGFTWGVKPAMGAWAGDKSNVPSNTPTTVPFNATATRWAGGHDIAREFRDFDVPEFWESYFQAMTDSYAQLSDDDALTQLLAGATAVTAGAVPSGINAATVSLIDGAIAVLPNGIPSFAIVASDVYRSLLLQSQQGLLGTLNQALGLEDGELAGFKIVPNANIPTGKALVGTKASATVWELPGSPIRTEALDQIRGGVDEALFGYSLTAVTNPLQLALVTPAGA